MRGIRIGALSTTLALSGLSACTSSLAADAGSTAATGPVGALVAACPSAVPTGGSPCAEPGELACEYGDDWDPLCNDIAQCWRGGSLDSTWQIQAPASAAGGPCPTPVTFGPGCPAGEPQGGIACAPAAALCPYDAGLCGCFQLGDTPDASGSWVCSSPGPGCPAARPRIGSACAPTAQNDYCLYAVCGIGGVTSCTNGVWGEGVLVSHCE